MAGLKNSQTTPYRSLPFDPLDGDRRHGRRASDGDRVGRNLARRRFCGPHFFCDDKENAVPPFAGDRDTLSSSSDGGSRNLIKSPFISSSSGPLKTRTLRSSSSASSLQLCIRLNEPDSSGFGPLKPWEPPVVVEKSQPLNVWDLSDSESAPASSWSTLPNRSLLCRPLSLDVGRCTCIIVKEASQGLGGMSVYSLYTNEGPGRQDRKLAVARHRRRNGRSEFIVAQNEKGIVCSSDECFLGTMTANLMGSRYHIWDQGSPHDLIRKQPKRLLGVVAFVPTIKTLTGSYRSMRAWVPKQKSMQLKNTSQIKHISGLPEDWEERISKTHRLFSKVPHYNSVSKRYELDFRERAGKSGQRIQTSVKNFQLIMEENGRQTMLQLGRVGKSKYVMDFRFPLTGYQAFCICLTSIDSKLCCSV